MKTKAFPSVVAVLAALGLLAGSPAPVAAQRGGAPAAPRFSGVLDGRQKEFNAFIIRNLNKRVYLDLGFASEDTEPIGYKDGKADPFFEAGNCNYFLQCQEPMTAHWTTRCAVLNWNPQRRAFVGYFRVSEPSPKTMRTNRTFVLAPAGR